MSAYEEVLLSASPCRVWGGSVKNCHTLLKLLHHHGTCKSAGGLCVERCSSLFPWNHGWCLAPISGCNAWLPQPQGEEKARVLKGSVP